MTQQPQSWLACTRSFCKTKTDTTAATSLPPPKSTSAYPPISSIPRTSASRLAQSALLSSTSPEAALFDAPIPADPNHEFTSSPPLDSKSPPRPRTILYLAYGSNLAAETFLGRRGIRPVSQTNVSAPSLRLTFDLPGQPFAEPCYANTALRRIPKIPNRPPKIPDIPDIPSPPLSVNQHGDPIWDAGLIGVVYEITPKDWAHIVATEGAGVAYQDVLVPCAELPPTVRVPEKPPVPELPRPFLAHTLLAPTRLPGETDDNDDEISRISRDDFYSSRDGNNGDDTPPPSIPKWALPFLRPITRPDPEYAQPSARYLNLLISGAREHDLPQDYQIWLQSLHPYQRTTFRQTLGQWAVMILFFPLLALVFSLSGLLSDDKGRMPLWLAVMVGAVFKSIWWSYDAVLKPLFGDGERTVENGEKMTTSVKAGERAVMLDEKRALLS